METLTLNMGKCAVCGKNSVRTCPYCAKPLCRHHAERARTCFRRVMSASEGEKIS